MLRLKRIVKIFYMIFYKNVKKAEQKGGNVQSSVFEIM